MLSDLSADSAPFTVMINSMYAEIDYGVMIAVVLAIPREGKKKRNRYK